MVYPAPDSLKNNLYNHLILNGWRATVDSAKINIEPSDDDRPFIAQMGLWDNLDFSKMTRIAGYSDWLGFPLSRLIVVIILAVALILLTPINLLPYLYGGDKLKLVPWLYFFTIGMAFMSLEIILIQKYTLFIGPSIYSIITILFTLFCGPTFVNATVIYSGYTFEDNAFADSIVSYSPGTDVGTGYDDATAALGQPDYSGANNTAVSLG